MKPIPFNRPLLLPSALEYVQQAATFGHLSGDGPFTKRCHALLEHLLGVPKVLLTTSCTHALEMAALLLSIQPGDEVIVPAFTFVSTVNAFVLRGAKPIFCDIRPDTLNLDEMLVESLITPRTRAIVPVHYAGVACEMDVLLRLAQHHHLAIVEDNAHGLFGRYRGQALGTFGCLATQSFHETKNISCGEGGALLINDPSLIERAEIIREKGTNRNRFFRGQVDKYTWVDVGSSFLPSDALAALLFAQLESWQLIQSKRQWVWISYAHGLAEWAAENGVRLPMVPAHCEHPYHLFYLLLPTLEDRQAFIAHTKRQGISTVFHYLPLNASPMGQRLGGHVGQCPVTEAVSDRLVRLPLFFDLTEDDVNRIIATVTSFRGSQANVSNDPLAVTNHRQAA
jgi:dTDP-4-amino-4,6-dideoxygalactose transaminase